MGLGICWGWTQGRPSCRRPTLGWGTQSRWDWGADDFRRGRRAVMWNVVQPWVVGLGIAEDAILFVEWRGLRQGRDGLATVGCESAKMVVRDGHAKGG